MILAILGVQVDALLIEMRIAGSVQRVADRVLLAEATAEGGVN